MLLMRNCWATRGLSSTFSFPITHRPPDSPAILSIVGPSILQGGHHSAQASISTGLSPADEITCWKLESVTVTGFPSPDASESTVPQRPHFGVAVAAARSSTRFFAPQLGQVTMDMTAVSLVARP